MTTKHQHVYTSIQHELYVYRGVNGRRS